MHCFTFSIIAGLTIASMNTAKAADLTLEEADSRLRHAYELGRETNDSTLLDRLLEYRDLTRRAFGRKDIAAAQRLVRDAEEAVGLEAGGKMMLGLPVGRVDPHLRKKFESIEQQLAEAMNGADPAAVGPVVSELRKLLGDSAGVPDVRRRGESAKAAPVKSEEVASTFLKLIEADPRALKALTAGMPGTDTLPRSYASIVMGCLTIRPAVEKHFKDKLAVIDDLARGCCKAMLALQVKAGHFKFPDVRAQNLLIGDVIEKLVEKNPDANQDGWIVVPFPDGMSQVDASECGIALLRAGIDYKNAEWIQAGLAAATWSKDSPLTANFVHNAYSVSLLCAASKAKPNDKFREAAWQTFSRGVVPGQTTTGRLIDPRNARTANQFVFIRAIQDLREVLPAATESESLNRVLQLAIVTVLDEADKLGVPMTSHTVQELARFNRPDKDTESKTQQLLEESATVTFKRASQPVRVRVAVPLPELAAVSRVWTK